MRGFRRIKPEFKNKLFNKLEKTFFSKCLKQSPGWAEITYVNSLSESQLFEERDFFLSWIFSTVLGQHGHALDVSRRADEIFESRLFKEMTDFSIRKMKIPIYLLPYYYLKKSLSSRYR
jgi:hypothetical protein